MAGMIRREALRKLGAGSIAAALFAGNASGASSRSAERAVALRGRLGIENAEGRTLRGFIETGIAECIVLCTLMEAASPATPKWSRCRHRRNTVAAKPALR